MGLILQGGTIVTDIKSYKADVRIENERIAEIGSDLFKEGDEIVPINGCYLVPGGIDTHTHFDLDVGTTITADNFETGTKAAIVGGTTTILDFATQSKENTLNDGLREWHDKSSGRCYSDYGFHMAITDWNDTTSKEMEDMINEGVTSFKMYMAYKDTLQVDDGIIFKALKRAKELGVLIGFHCENGDIINELINECKENNQLSPKYHQISRPVDLEVEATYRLMKIAKTANAPVYVVHLSSKAALEEVKKARLDGVKVYTETCPQYLLLDDKLYDLDGFESAKYVMSPPLRKKVDNEALWKALEDGDIDAIGTDHCSFNYKGQKDIGINDFSKIPNGGPGVEHRMGLLYTYGVKEGKISMNKFVELTSTKAAKLFGMYPQKGSIEVGSDADLVVIDPEIKNTISAENQTQNTDYTPYEGYEVDCQFRHVFLRGIEIIKEGKLTVEHPTGKYIVRTIN
ncbi:dihydropyrimidinase [[Clostridium] bifermentans ATCC 638]|uniref:Dihydropyrimidinase n=1 Tax=Paraclostridium bifermentans ATCC 638 = DSM 14991 TaxID=1233171 RepID=T4VJH3_PARBF|nr:dihydropyrimidinase [Paraclostridium bifermentans]EQK41265.1 dihydropyrimidinase [[Clostridium] bifermentans ATCC 638] [Paraclostridium bifermentans ATCC 638 = DSM 14991]RIZ58955.1 dihydropyrimidinase [Paraclostridium bifermentans]UAG18525.1 dihydropyrimidinase [Paraclostridium bifermentans]